VAGELLLLVELARLRLVDRARENSDRFRLQQSNIQTRHTEPGVYLSAMRSEVTE
jgi:hypothetical protein